VTFERADAARFFGRRELVSELLTRLAEQHFLAVFGPSRLSPLPLTGKPSASPEPTAQCGW
jgi:hypothetical protein